MTSLLSVNLSATGLATPAGLHELGVKWIRLPLWPKHPMRAIVQALVNGGINVLPCCDHETYSVSTDPLEREVYWHRQLGDLVTHYQAGHNEYDQIGSTSSTAAEAVVRAQLKAARAVWRSHTIIGPNCASGQPDRWTKPLDDLVDAVGLSRYPPNAAQMGDGIYGPDGYRRFGKPIWINEFPVWSDAHITEAMRLSDGPAGIYNWQSWWATPEAYWNDGLLDRNHQKTWRWHLAHHHATANQPPPIDPRTLLFGVPAGARR